MRLRIYCHRFPIRQRPDAVIPAPALFDFQRQRIHKLRAIAHLTDVARWPGCATEQPEWSGQERD